MLKRVYLSFAMAIFLAAFINGCAVETVAVELEASPEEMGVVNGDGEFAKGETVTVEAEPGEGYIFKGWTIDGEEVSTEKQHEFEIKEDTILKANFRELIPDENLEAAIKDELGLDRRITKEDLEGLKELSVLKDDYDMSPFFYAYGIRSWVLKDYSDLTYGLPEPPFVPSDIIEFSGIKRLDGLEYAINLEILNLFSSKVENITPLSELQNLKELNLKFNREIRDIEPLSDLQNLQALNLGCTPITNFDPLANLHNLEKLEIWSSLPVDEVFDTALLSGLENLEYLILWDGQAKELEALSDLPSLKHLSLSLWEQESNTVPLSDLHNLESLEILTDSQIDVSLLTDLQNLKMLKLGSQVRKIDNLGLPE